MLLINLEVKCQERTARKVASGKQAAQRREIKVNLSCKVRQKSGGKRRRTREKRTLDYTRIVKGNSGWTKRLLLGTRYAKQSLGNILNTSDSILCSYMGECLTKSSNNKTTYRAEWPETGKTPSQKTQTGRRPDMKLQQQGGFTVTEVNFTLALTSCHIL